MTRAVLLDIEGTTTPISFVYETLFPYARRRGPAFLREFWDTPELTQAKAQLHQQNTIDVAEGAPPLHDVDTAVDYYLWLMERDSKVTPLKSIQGMIWSEGFASGELRGEVFDDVPRALIRWKKAGRPVSIYSSGSVLSQQLLFRHCNAGDLTPLLHSYFDTAVGGKREAASYRTIFKALGTDEALFVSDVPAELDAAREAGLETALSLRPGNNPINVQTSHRTIRSFDELD